MLTALTSGQLKKLDLEHLEKVRVHPQPPKTHHSSLLVAYRHKEELVVEVEEAHQVLALHEADEVDKVQVRNEAATFVEREADHSHEDHTPHQHVELIHQTPHKSDHVI